MRNAPSWPRRILSLLLCALLAAGALPAASAHDPNPDPVGAGVPLSNPTQPEDHGIAPATKDPFWNVVGGFAAKSGYRLVFFYDADRPVLAQVVWGTSSNALIRTGIPVSDVADTAGIIIVDLLPTDVDSSKTIYFRITDRQALNPASPMAQFQMGNAWSSDTEDGVYEINLLVQMDAEAVPDEAGAPDQSLESIAAAMDVFAERVWDMTDGYVRIGTVLVTDTILNAVPPNVPNPVFLDPTGALPLPPEVAGSPTPCLSEQPGELYPHTQNNAGTGDMMLEVTPADIVFQTAVPFDSHTWIGADKPAIDSLCTAIYMGRVGQAGATSGWGGDVDLGYTLAHELGHYAMGLADLSGAAGDCIVGTSGTPGEEGNWDISLMNDQGGWNGKRWVQSELDRTGTPCPRAGPASWATMVRFYPDISETGRFGDDLPVHSDSDFKKARGNPDGGAFGLFVLDHESPALSRVMQLAAPVPPPPPVPEIVSRPAVLFEDPLEGGIITSPVSTARGVVDRLYEVPGLRVDAFGPYFGGQDTPISLKAEVLGGSGDYQCTWSSPDDAAFEDFPATPCSALDVSFPTTGLKVVQLEVLDLGDGKTKVRDQALVNVLVPVLEPSGCGKQEGLRVVDDAQGDSADSQAQATDLVCFGVQAVPNGLTFQVEVVNRASSPGFPESVGDQEGPHDTYYVIHFTPTFGALAGSPQAIKVSWLGTGTLESCFLLDPAGDACDDSRVGPPASWDGNTLLVTMPFTGVGTPAANDVFDGFYAQSWHMGEQETLPGTGLGALTGFTHSDDDFAPDARNARLVFEAGGQMRVEFVGKVCADDQAVLASPNIEVLGFNLIKLCAEQDDTYLTLTLTAEDLVLDSTATDAGVDESPVVYNFFIGKDPSSSANPPNHYSVTHAMEDPIGFTGSKPAEGVQIAVFPQNAVLTNSLSGGACTSGDYCAFYDYATNQVTFRIALTALDAARTTAPYGVAVGTQVGDGTVLWAGLKENLEAGLLGLLPPAGSQIPYQDLLPNVGLITVPTPSASPASSGGAGGLAGPGSGGWTAAFDAEDPEGQDPPNDGLACSNFPLPMDAGTCGASDVRAIWVDGETDTTFSVVVKVQDLATAPPAVYQDMQPPVSDTAVYVGYIMSFCIRKPDLLGPGQASDVCYAFWFRDASVTELGGQPKVTTAGPTIGSSTCTGGENPDLYVVGGPIFDRDADTIRLIFSKAAFDVESAPATCPSKVHNGIGVRDDMDILHTLDTSTGYAFFFPTTIPGLGYRGIQLIEDSVNDAAAGRIYRFGQSGLKADSGGPYQVTPGETLLIEGEAIKPKGGEWTCFWSAPLLDFVSASSNDCLVEVTCMSPGLYIVRLTIIDAAGQVAEDTARLKCGSPDSPKEFVLLTLDGRPLGPEIATTTSLAQPLAPWSLEMELTDDDNGFRSLTAVWFDDFGFTELAEASINVTISLPALSESKEIATAASVSERNATIATRDSDADGHADEADNCVRVANSDQKDLDGDGLGDVCDPDQDGDGWPDAQDDCPTTAGADQADADGDGKGDLCDADDDEDGTEDGKDNCPLDPNPAQLDSDRDGLGDACDGDDDNDGVLDLFDQFPKDGAEASDFDRDGEGDAADVDDDGDGIPDEQESLRDRYNAAGAGPIERPAELLESPERGSPGLGGLALLAAIGVAFVLTRRR